MSACYIVSYPFGILPGTASPPRMLAAVLVLAIALIQLGAGEPTCNPTGRYLVENPRDCRSYYYCFDGQPIFGTCGPGHRFDAWRQSCQQSTVQECFPCPSSGAINMPHPTSCGKFVLCFQGVAHERSCPTGLLFNRQLAQCDLSSNVSCS
ncbi:peritrophin-1-like [Anopheles nili]|uniref:peritrophin-1-like n=1 Tax=Anopheles nili TaxID=185578 RepID=UPI00237BF936|nr:peritrophin-1-like [Anopheles nili]